MPSSLSVASIAALSEPSRFPDAVSKALIERIEAGVYPAGSKLPSTKGLAEAFQVSMPIVREALSQLKYDGYVEPRQGSGVYVKDRSVAPPSLRLEVGDCERLAQAFEVRWAVEQACAGLAAQRRTDEDLRDLQQALDDILQAMEQGEDATEADVRFHLAVAAATQNASLHRLTRFLHGALHTSVHTARGHSRQRPGWSAQAEREHQAIFDAIRNRQPQAAQQAMGAHLHGAAKRLQLPPVTGESDINF